MPCGRLSRGNRGGIVVAQVARPCLHVAQVAVASGPVRRPWGGVRRAEERRHLGPRGGRILPIRVLVRRHEWDVPRHAGRLRGQVEVDAVEEVSLLDVEQELTVRGPASVESRPGHADGVARALAEWQDLEGADVVVRGETDLLEVIGALGSPGRLSSRLDRGQEEER